MANCSVENCMETKGIVLYGPSRGTAASIGKYDGMLSRWHTASVSCAESVCRQVKSITMLTWQIRTSARSVE